MEKRGEEKKRKKKRKGLDTCLDLLWFCLNLLWVLYGYKFVQFLRFSEEFILTLESLKVRFVNPNLYKRSRNPPFE